MKNILCKFFLYLFGRFSEYAYLCTANQKWLQSECSAVGSALRSGRRGRAFESPHSDRKGLTLLSELNLFFVSVCKLLCRYVIGMRAEAGVLLSVWKMEFAWIERVDGACEVFCGHGWCYFKLWRRLFVFRKSESVVEGIWGDWVMKVRGCMCENKKSRFGKNQDFEWCHQES